MKAYLILACSLLLISSCKAVKNFPATAGKSEEGKMIEQGTASWYGPNFHGKKTANGEVFDMNELTAAHRTLPFNSVVTVTNLTNGRSVTVRINDRGPYAKNRIIDLSKKAAEQLQMITAGTAQVQLSLVHTDRELSKELATPHYAVQVGSYSSKAAATQKQRSISGARVQQLEVDQNIVYRVLVGNYTSVDQARQLKSHLASQGISGFVKQVEN